MACAWRERGNGQASPRSSKVLSSMATIRSPGVDTAPRRSKRWLIESCSRPGSRRANSTAPPAPMATSAATTAMTVRPETPLRSRVPICSAHPACEVALAGVEDDGAAGVHVADGDAAGGDARERAVATIRDEPGRAPHRDDAVARPRAEVAVAVVAPERARRAPAAGHGGGACATGWARWQRPAQHEVDHAVAARGLAHLEQAAVEGPGLGPARRQGALQLHGPGPGVDHRADRHRGALGERRRVGRPRYAYED